MSEENKLIDKLEIENMYLKFQIECYKQILDESKIIYLILNKNIWKEEYKVHFCPDWDYMLINKEMHEFKNCLCYR